MNHDLMTKRRVQERRSKKLVLLVTNSDFWADIQRLERESGLSVVNIRKDAEDTERWRLAALRGKSGDKTGGRIKKRTAQPLAQPIYAFGIDNAHSSRAELLGISDETLRKIKREELGSNHRIVEDKFASLVRGLKHAAELLAENPKVGGLSASVYQRAQKILNDLLADDHTSQAVYTTAVIMGMSMSDAQRAIDEATLKNTGILKNPYQDSHNVIERMFSEVEGAFYAWVGRFTGDKIGYLRCCLHVRYVLELREKFVIRAKLNVPAISASVRPEQPFFQSDGKKKPAHEYDGFCDTRNANRLQFIFETRSQHQSDYFYWILSRMGADLLNVANQPSGARAYFGHYMTCAQTHSQEVAWGPVILIPHPLINPTLRMSDRRVYEGEIQKFMWEEPEFFPQGTEKFAQMNSLARDLGARNEGAK